MNVRIEIYLWVKLLKFTHFLRSYRTEYIQPKTNETKINRIETEVQNAEQNEIKMK